MASIPKLLEEYASGYGARAFDWEVANCCHFAAGWIKLRTGVDPMEGLPTTPGAKDARRLLRVLGGLRQAMTARSGCRQIVATLAQVGDVVLRNLPDGGVALGICAGRTAMHVDESGQIVHLEMAGALCAWRIEGESC